MKTTTEIPETPVTRGYYNQITPADTPKWVHQIIESLDGTCFTTGIASEKHGLRGEAINTDVYSFDSNRHLAVIQVRLFRWGRRYPTIRKDYYLIGVNENGNPFAHPVDPPTRSRVAMKTAEGGVTYTLSKIWDCDPQDLHEIVRNGDIAFIPDRLPTDSVELTEDEVKIDSHVVRGKSLWRSPSTGSIYCKGKSRLSHTKGQHPTAQVPGGIWRIQHGIRAGNWGFTAPSAD